MPAIELNSYPPSVIYDQARQKALFKLWLILTTNQLVVSPSTRTFPTTAQAESFTALHANIPEPLYFVDLEKLTAALAPLSSSDVQTVFDLLNDKSPGGTQAQMQSTTSNFYALGEQILNYGHVNCNSVQQSLDVGLPANEAGEQNRPRKLPK